MKDIDLIVSLLDKKQAEDIRVLDIQGVSTIADYFIIANSKNSQHLKSLVEEIGVEMEKVGLGQRSIEGGYESGWVLVDFGGIVLHLFDKENRMFYKLEKIWRDGKEIETQNIVGGK